MRTYLFSLFSLFSFFFLLLTALLMVMFIQQRSEISPTDNIAVILADVPNQTASDQRKRATLAEACLSIAELIRADAVTDADEVIAAFRIETANLRNDEDWHSIQKRIEVLLQRAETMDEQETLLRRLSLFSG